MVELMYFFKMPFSSIISANFIFGLITYIPESNHLFVRDIDVHILINYL